VSKSMQQYILNWQVQWICAKRTNVLSYCIL